MIVGLPTIHDCCCSATRSTRTCATCARVWPTRRTRSSRAASSDDAQASQTIDIVCARSDSATTRVSCYGDGKIAVGLAIPRDFERRLALTAIGAPAQLLVDGSDPAVLQAARGASALPCRSVRASAAGPPRAAPVFELRAFYNPERRSAVQIVPALIGVILTMTMVLFTAIAIVRERERGNLELLINTPVRTTELMLGKIAPYVAIGMVQTTLILAARSLRLRRADPRQPARAVCRVARVRRGVALARPALLDARLDPDPGLSADVHTFLPQILMRASCSRSTACPGRRAVSPSCCLLTHFLRIVRGCPARRDARRLWRRPVAAGMRSSWRRRARDPALPQAAGLARRVNSPPFLPWLRSAQCGPNRSRALKPAPDPRAHERLEIPLERAIRRVRNGKTTLRASRPPRSARTSRASERARLRRRV